MLPLTPKSNKIFSRKAGSLASSLLEFSLSCFVGIFNKSKPGSLNLVFSCSLSFSAFMNGRSS
jgi:hypothetical protein